MIEDVATRHAERDALVWRGARLSWLELLAWIQARADALQRDGVRQGDAVVLLHPNGADFVIDFFAATALGAAAVPLDPKLTVPEIRSLLAGVPVAAIACGSDAAERGRQVAEALPGPVAVRVPEPDEKLPAAPLRPRHRRRVAPETPALHGFSSGTTGTAKRIVRSHAQLRHEADNFCATVGLGPADRILGVAPFFHAHGLGNCVLAAVRSGATLVVQDGPDRREVLEALERERVTVFPAVPVLLRNLAARSSRADLSALRLCFTAGTALPVETFEAFRDRFGCPVRQLYGCTEAGSVCINLDPDVEATRESVGRPVRGVEVAVLDTQRRPGPPGVVGEVALRSPAAGTGYEGLDDVNREAFVDGWFRTGDLGVLDDEGRLTLRGRIKLFIDTPAGKVDPLDVERCAEEHPAVLEAGAVGVPSRHGGEIVKLVVAVGGEWRGDDVALRRELVARCRERLAEFKLPRVVELRRELPRSPAGKLLRAKLVGSDSSQSPGGTPA